LIIKEKSYLGFPHQPKFENVTFPATLEVFVTQIVAGIVVFVPLEQIFSPVGMATLQNVRVTDKKHGALLWYGQQLMRV